MRGDRLHGVRAANGLRAGLGQAEMLNFPIGDQLLDRARHVLDWHVRVNAMLVEEVDGLDTQPLQPRVAHLADVLGPTIEARLLLSLRVDIEAELCRNHHLVSERSKRFTDHFLIGKGP
jgi:hypothetical protein